MKFTVDMIKTTYIDLLPHAYDEKLSPSYEEWKRHAINASNMMEGDVVIIFCCGTGSDFSPILEKIGLKGKILGVDFSLPMLKIAEKKIQQEGWNNVELINADVTEFQNNHDIYIDAGICTLGMSIIPQWERAYKNLLSYVKTDGEIIIGDMMLTRGFRFLMNARNLYFAKEFGGTYKGYKNSRQLFTLMERELSDVRKKKFYYGTYCYCIGRKP